MNCKNHDDAVALVLSLLDDEIKGDVGAALSKLTANYTMTWMYRSQRTGVLFPKAGRYLPEFERDTQDIYRVKGRHYDIRNIATGQGLVMIELVESYPALDTGLIFRTPLVLVIEIIDNKVARGRHYCDPLLSHSALSKEEVDSAFT